MLIPLPVNVSSTQNEIRASLSGELISLKCELRDVASRLGSPHERPEDLEEARELAHELRNLQHVLELYGAMDAMTSRGAA